MPRSKHGRVLTQSRRFKGNVDRGPSATFGHEKQRSYILCHVRRIIEKKDEENKSEGSGKAKEVRKPQSESMKKVAESKYRQPASNPEDTTELKKGKKRQASGSVSKLQEEVDPKEPKK